MKLKFPDSCVDFDVGPGYFLGDFDIYDREESLGKYLSKFDPNDKLQLVQLYEEKFFRGGRISKLSIQHRSELLKVLAEALIDSSYDFEKLLSHDREPDDHFCLPGNWKIANPRKFFEEIYKMSYERWSSDIESVDILAIHPSELKQ